MKGNSHLCPIDYCLSNSAKYRLGLFNISFSVINHPLKEVHFEGLGRKYAKRLLLASKPCP